MLTQRLYLYKGYSHLNLTKIFILKDLFLKLYNNFRKHSKKTL